MSKSQQQFKITVTTTRNRKPKTTNHHITKLLDVLQDTELLGSIKHPDLFVSVLSTAISDLRE